MVNQPDMILKSDLLNSEDLALKLVYNQIIVFVFTYGGIVYDAEGKI
jgi:hypothetical protein